MRRNKVCMQCKKIIVEPYRTGSFLCAACFEDYRLKKIKQYGRYNKRQPRKKNTYHRDYNESGKVIVKKNKILKDFEQGMTNAVELSEKHKVTDIYVRKILRDNGYKLPESRTQTAYNMIGEGFTDEEIKKRLDLSQKTLLSYRSTWRSLHENRA